MHNLIDRDALKRDVRDVVFRVADTPLSNDAMSKLVFQMGELVRKKIDEAPGVDAEPVRHGRWINKTEKRRGFSDYRFDCSACNHIFWASGIETFKYCPWCGAKMDKEVKEDARDIV